MSEEIETIRSLRIKARFAGNPATAAEFTRRADELEGLAPSVPAVEKPAILAGKEIKETASGYVTACPACRSAGGDTKGEHLLVYPDGGFACVLWPLGHPDEDARAEHRSQIRKALGLSGGEGWATPVDTSAQDAVIKVGFEVLWEIIKDEFSGPISSIGESGPLPEKPYDHFAAWCKNWQPGRLAWAGHRKESREVFRSHLFEPADPTQAEAAWAKIVWGGLDHCFLRAISPKAESREEKNAEGKPNFLERVKLVVERDHTAWEDQVALVRYCREGKGLNLRMIVGTGGAGFHAIFDIPPHYAMDDLNKLGFLLTGLGADPVALKRCATRVPGAIRQGDEKKEGGKLQQILWIATEEN